MIKNVEIGFKEKIDNDTGCFLYYFHFIIFFTCVILGHVLFGLGFVHRSGSVHEWLPVTWLGLPAL